MRAERALTERQKNTLKCIIDFIAKYGYPPTFREIADLLNIEWTSMISSHMIALKRKGYVTYTTSARTIVVLKGLEEEQSDNSANNEH